tara:strand:+ start:814 stop:1206 length:393 start_codon:yes stop_codon:yes gene_type:complete
MKNLKKEKNKSNKSFGIVFFIFFLIIALWPLMNDGEIRIWSIILALLFLILGLINSKILTPLHRLWIKLGYFLGYFVSPIIMGMIFFLIISPVGIIMRLFGKDTLMKKYSKKSTYWIQREKKINSMKKQF